jgi:uncharacterized lipoprotein YddW (UPF0748 family)
MLKKLSILTLGIFIVFSCSKKAFPLSEVESSIEYQIIHKDVGISKREFRGAWVASIANIDWPSKKGLDSETQKKEFSAIVNHHKNLGINALVVQVRAASDAFYAKSSEPWSEWLMGEQGKAPTPFYDPMEYMITESHKNGLEFHAWLNLNRGKHRLANSILENHLVNTKPEWFLTYDDYKLYNFGIPEVRRYILDIVLNIVREYDVDGIHFDDYFYPYKVNGQSLKDEDTFKKYPNGFTSIEDWRRNNIDLIIKEISVGIKIEKSWVSFGISPFGVWRNDSDDPKGSETRGGQPSYDFLFADTRKWAIEGWIDYIVPQIYFPFEHKLVPYGTLTDWWVKNHGKANLFIGHGVYRVDKASSLNAWKDPNQIPRQMDYNRYSKEITGSIFYNTNTLINNNLGLKDSIATRYQYPALGIEVRSDNKRLVVKPSNFQSKENGNGVLFTWQSNSKNTILYRFEKGEKLNIDDPRSILKINTQNQYLDSSREANKTYVYLLTAVDRWNNESEAVIIEN